jgi:DNA-binding MarR family transcriptional regulator
MERFEEVLMALRRIIRAVDLQSKYLMQTSGLTGPQLLVLQAIDRGTAVSVSDIARQVSLSQGTVTSILDRLENKGLVARARSTIDRRKAVIRLTEGGAVALSQAPTLLQTRFVQAFLSLKDWEQTLILSSLQRVAEMMGAQDLDAAPLLEVQSLPQ